MLCCAFGFLLKWSTHMFLFCSLDKQRRQNSELMQKSMRFDGIRSKIYLREKRQSKWGFLMNLCASRFASMLVLPEETLNRLFLRVIRSENVQNHFSINNEELKKFMLKGINFKFSIRTFLSNLITPGGLFCNNSWQESKTW